VPDPIAMRLDLDNGRALSHRAGAQLGPSDIHRDPTVALERSVRPTQVLDHLRPGGRVVMGAVDAHAIHPRGDEVANQHIVRSGLAGHRHHDADGSSLRRWTEQRVAVCSEQHFARLFRQRRRVERAIPREAFERVQDPQHRFEAVAHV
jgi:hypothetical protein